MEYLSKFFLPKLEKTNVQYKEEIFTFFEDYEKANSCNHISTLKELEECEEVDEILYADLSSENLHEIPYSLFACRNLKALDLSTNMIFSIKGISKFKNLEYLFLDDCEPLTNIPSEIGQLKLLKGISISETPITSLPKEFSNLKYLVYCRLNNNELANDVLFHLESSKNLVELDLSSNQIIVFDKPFLSFPNLIDLDFSYNNFELLPIIFSDCPLLEELDFSNNPIQELPDTLGQLRNLQTLDMGGCLLKQMPNLTKLVSCKRAVIGHTEMKNIPVEVFTIPNLLELEIEHSNIKSLPEEIGNLTKLENLTVEESKLKTLPKTIGNLGNLLYLNLRDNRLKQLPSEMGNLTKLNTLNLSNWDDGGNQLSYLPSWIGNLKSLSDLEVYGIGLELLPKEIGNLINLSRIDLSRNSLNSLPLEFANLRKLKSLNLYDCPMSDMSEIQDMGIDELFEYLNQKRGIGKYAFTWELPESFQTAFQQYLNFFTDYIKSLEGHEINLNVLKTPGGVKLETQATENLTIEEIGKYLNGYIDYIRENVEINESNEYKNPKMELLVVRLEGQILHFKQQIKLIKFENKYLKKSMDKLLEAHVNFSNIYQEKPLLLTKKVKTFKPNKKKLKNIQQLIIKNEFEKAFNDLGILLNQWKPSKNKELTILFSRWNGIIYEARMGIIDFNQKQQELNKIRAGLIEILEDLN